VLAQRDDGGARDERHVGQLDAVALLIFRLFALAQPNDARHVHLEDGVDVWAGLLGFDHAARDDAAHLGHGNQAAGDGSIRGGSCGGGLAGAAAGAGFAAGFSM